LIFGDSRVVLKGFLGGQKNQTSNIGF